MGGATREIARVSSYTRESPSTLPPFIGRGKVYPCQQYCEGRYNPQFHVAFSCWCLSRRLRLHRFPLLRSKQTWMILDPPDQHAMTSNGSDNDDAQSTPPEQGNRRSPLGAVSFRFCQRSPPPTDDVRLRSEACPVPVLIATSDAARPTLFRHVWGLKGESLFPLFLKPCHQGDPITWATCFLANQYGTTVYSFPRMSWLCRTW